MSAARRARRLAWLLPGPAGAGDGDPTVTEAATAAARRRPRPRDPGSRATWPRCAARRRRRRGHRARQARRSGSPCGAPRPAGVAVVPCDNLPDNGAMVAARASASWPRPSTPPRRLDRGARRVRDHDGRPDHPAHHRRRPRRGAEHDRRGRPRPGGHRALHRVGALPATSPQGRPRWEDVGARFVDDIVPWEHRKLWLLNGVALADGLRRHAPRPRDRRAGGLRPGRARLGGAVVGRRRTAPAAAPRGDHGLPGRAAGALREPADPPPAAPDRGRRLPEGADPVLPAVRADLADGPGPDRCGPRPRRVDLPPAGAGRAGGRRGGRGVHPRSPRAISTTPWAACWPGSASTTRG